MDRKTQAKLERAGCAVADDASGFLELTEEERAIVAARLALARFVRTRRIARGQTQEQLAKAMKSSQSRVGKIEAADASVSIELMLKALAATGSTITIHTKRDRLEFAIS